MIKFLSWAHGWFGVVFGLLFGFLFFTGAVLMVETMINQYELAKNIPAIEQPLTPEKIAADLDALQAAAPEMGLNLAAIRVPLDLVPAYRLSEPRGGQTVYVAADDFAPIEVGHSSLLENPAVHKMLLAFTDWHVSIIDGTRWGGVFAIIGSVLGLVGLIIFWPWRRTFNWRNWGWPKNFGRASLMSNHLTAGMLSFVFLLLFGVTGAFLEYRREISDYLTPIEQSRAVDQVARLQQINRDLGPVQMVYLEMPADSRSTQAESISQQQAAVRPELGAIDPVEMQAPTRQAAAPATTLVAQKLPLSELAMRAMRAAPGEIPTDVTGFNGNKVTFRMRDMGTSLQPLGRTYLSLDAHTGEVLSAEFASDRIWQRKLTHISGPLHMGGEVTLVYQALAVIGSLLVSVICLTGTISFVRKKLVKSLETPA